jgi:hypothetical protein
VMYAQFCQSCASCVYLFTSSELLVLALSRGLWGMSEGLDDCFSGCFPNMESLVLGTAPRAQNPGPSSPTSSQALSPSGQK